MSDREEKQGNFKWIGECSRREGRICNCGCEEKKRQVEQKAYASAQSAQYYAGQVSHDLEKVVDALGVAYNHLDWFNDSHRRSAVLYNLTHLQKLDLLMKEVREQEDCDEEKLQMGKAPTDRCYSCSVMLNTRQTNLSSVLEIWLQSVQSRPSRCSM